MDSRRFHRYLTLRQHVSSTELSLPSPAAGDCRRAEAVLELAPPDTYEVVVHGFLTRKRFVLDSRQPHLLVGSSERCDIRLVDSAVRPEHVYFQRLDCGVCFVDLESDPTAARNGEERRFGWLSRGDSLPIGPFQASLAGSGDLALPAERPVIDLLSETGLQEIGTRNVHLALLNARRDSGGTDFWTVRHPISLVGSNAQCVLRLNDASVCGVHCSLIALPDGLWISDLHSDNGTWVNGERVVYQLLQQDDRVQIGEFCFRVDYAESPADRPPEKVRGPGTQDFRRPKKKRKRRRRQRDHELILSLVDRFSSMQQHMFDLHHEQMMSILQLIGGMNANYHETVQAELVRVHQLTQQIKELQQRISADPSPDESTDDPAIGSTDHESESPAGGPVPNRQPESFETSAMPRVAATTRDRAERLQRSPASQVEKNAELFERIDKLHRERSSRWQRILRTLTGSL